MARLLLGCALAAVFAARSRAAVVASAPLRVPPVAALVQALSQPQVLPAAALPDPLVAAFLTRAAETHDLSAAPVAAPVAVPVAAPIEGPHGQILAAALSQALTGLDVDAIGRLPAERIGALSRQVWDRAAAAGAETPAVPQRYGKLHGALEDYLRGKGYHRALAAMEFARAKHVGMRKDGLTPEFQHQVEIALFIATLKDVRDPELALTAAMLHDVVEDYDVSREEIAERFGADVERVVWLLTKTYRGRHKEYADYFGAIALDPTASLVKGADRVNNLQSMVGVFKLEKQREYAEEAQRWFLPMLKSARRRFPDQTAAYFNIEHMIKSQLRLIDSFLNAAESADPARPLKTLARELAAEAPGARVDLNAAGGYVYVNREKVPDAEAFFGRLIERLRLAAGEAGVAVLDTTFAVPGDRLFSRNLVDGEAAARVEAELGADASYERLTPDQRARLLFEPFARRLDAEAGPAFFHVDHHYAPRLLASASTTPLVVDFLRFLQDTGRYSLIRRLQRSFAVLDHSDADIALAHLALRRAHEPSFLAEFGDLLKSAALFNDYVRETGATPDARGRAKVLYNVAAAVEGRLASGALKYAEAFRLLDAAARWAQAAALPAGVDVEEGLLARFSAADPAAPDRALRELFVEGAAEYVEELAALRGMTAAGVAEGPAAAMEPGTMRRAGPALLVFMKDGDRAVSNASVVRYLQAERPDLLAGVRVVVTTGAKDGTRFFKMRSFVGPDGRFLDLADPKDGLYALLNAGTSPAGKPYESAGRHFAGGAAKGGFGPLSPAETLRVLSDIAAAAGSATARQRL